jgi:hypothetical protein
MSKKGPDPSPPPGRTAEDRKFFDLLKKLVQVPKGEIDKKRAEHRKTRKRRSAKGKHSKKSGRNHGDAGKDGE